MYRFEVAGLWGSGNTLTERDLLYLGENTVYETWTGAGLLGPRKGVVLERYPALWGRIPYGEFLARYDRLDPERCRVFTGGEHLGIGCDALCAELSPACGDELELAECLAVCAELPRATITCLEHLDGCDLAACPAPREH